MTYRIDPKGRFTVGRIISPGHWHEHITLKVRQTELILFENHMEVLRKIHSPKAISRLNCVFSFDLDAAENFLSAPGNNGQNMEVVDLSYNNTPASEHNYWVISHFFKKIQAGTTLQSLLNEEPLMIAYWTNDYTNTNAPHRYDREILIGGEVEVVAIR